MKKTSFAEMRCSLARGLDRIGDCWSPLIIRDLFLGIARFDELVEDLGISRNLLTRRLNSLVGNGVVKRAAYQQTPVRYEYRLTEAGRDLMPAILALTAWGDRWARPKEGSPILFVHTSCGQQFRPQVSCSAYGRSAERGSPKPRDVRGRRIGCGPYSEPIAFRKSLPVLSWFFVYTVLEPARRARPRPSLLQRPSREPPLGARRRGLK
jgi:DNA-binding HxlR family transcriptional regulator